MARYINTRVLSLALVLVWGISGARAQAPAAGSSAGNKVGIVSIQDAIANTNEGKKELDALQQKFAPRNAALQSQNEELESLKKQLQTQGDKLSDEEKNKFPIDSLTGKNIIFGLTNVASFNGRLGFEGSVLEVLAK